VRVFLAVVLSLAWIGAAMSQSLTGLARVEAKGSHIKDGWFGGTGITLRLSQGVPYRVFTLDGPPRLVVDFSDAEFSQLDPARFAQPSRNITAVRFGRFAPGWSRLVADLAQPMILRSAALDILPQTGVAELRMALQETDAEAFAAVSGAPPGAAWGPGARPKAQVAPVAPGFVVVLDPGHGGIDPGAERDGLVEKDLALDFARMLRDILRRQGVAVQLTREADVFVSLEGRTAFAHRHKASLFLSIHADALPGGGAHGATVYTLSEQASDVASAQLAARHNRSDIPAGLDLTGADDEVTGVLLDLMRRETEPRSAALAKTIIARMDAAGGPMNRKPWRQAGFSVLKSADIPSALLEVGFLSSAQDRKNLADPIWRSVIAEAVAEAILDWRDADAARAQLVRQ